MATQAQPMPQQASQGQDQSQNQGQGGDSLQEWRQWAESGMRLARKYPEATEGMATIMREIQNIMTRVAGNPQRTPAAQAPPMAG